MDHGSLSGLKRSFFGQILSYQNEKLLFVTLSTCKRRDFSSFMRQKHVADMQTRILDHCGRMAFRQTFPTFDANIRQIQMPKKEKFVAVMVSKNVSIRI